jgi:phage terminase large subunit-like protein
LIDHIKKIKKHIAKEISQRESLKAYYDWHRQARPSQKLPSGDWKIWLILAGRGFGKTRTGAETVRYWATQKIYKRICLLGCHFDDVRRVMIEGESGLLSVSPQWENIQYEPSRRQISWPNGAVASAYSAASYAQLRGPQFDAVWIDELAKFPSPQEAWDQLMMGLRIGKNPRVIITTTPRPLPLIKKIMERQDVIVTQGTTFENQSNLAQNYIQEMRKSYEGTRLGAQELEGHVLQEDESGLWKTKMIHYCTSVPQLIRVIVAIDPAVTHGEKSDETGMIVAGIDAQGLGYILEDLSGRFSPSQWIHNAVDAYHRHNADRIIAEVNNGGDMVQQLLHSLHPHIPYQKVLATRSKMVRAEPISALYEQGKIFHSRYMPQLEDQMIRPQAYKSPDRLDALVWALTTLFFIPTSGAPKIRTL